MRDPWIRIVSEHLTALDLPEDERDEVIEEVAAHLRECAEELEREGATDATERTLAQVPDWVRLAANIRRVKEECMTVIGTDLQSQGTQRVGKRMLAVVVTAAVLLGATAGLVTSWVAPVRYRSTALIQVAAAETSGDASTASADGRVARIQDIMQRLFSRTRLERVIVDFNLYPDLRSQKIMEEVVEQFRRDISVVALKGDVISVRYVGSDPTVAMRVTEKLTAYVRDEGQIEAERSGHVGLFTLLEQARVPEQPFGPTRLQRVGVGAAAGLVGGLLIALALAFVRFSSGGRPQPQTA
jgi:uncharacterized protein involved in exopolysaccharide biosynthesis